MAGVKVPNLAFLRNIPVFGAKLYEALHGIQQGVNAVVKQTNANPNGEPDAPPNIDALHVTAQDGHFHFSITDQSSGLRRGVQYRIDHADNPAFTGAHQIVIGDTRSHDAYLGNVTRYFRASSSYASSPSSQHVYHGTQTEPIAVTGGGPTAGPAFLPSQGTGTGPAGQPSGAGTIPERTESSGFNWRSQRPIASGQIPAVSPGSENGIGSPGENGGGSSSVTLTESLIAAAETLANIAGTGNAITGTTSPAYSALAADFLIRYVPIHDNSGAVTLAVNGITAKAVTKNGSVALAGGELVTGRAYLLLYDGTRFELIGQVSPISAALLGSDAHGVPIVAPASGVTANTYGDSTHVGEFTVTAQGQITAASSVAIAFPSPYPLIIVPVLIAALPGTPAVGQIASVSNALAPVIGAAVAGTGTAFAAVMWNGSQWTVFSV